MSDLALDPKLKVVAEVAKELGRTERRIQQMIASGDLPARKATDFEVLALRKAGEERRAGDTGSSAKGGSSSRKSKGAQACSKCQRT